MRWSVANKIREVCDALGKDITVSSLAGAFEKLLRVRGAAWAKRGTRGGVR